MLWVILKTSWGQLVNSLYVCDLTSFRSLLRSSRSHIAASFAAGGCTHTHGGRPAGPQSVRHRPALVSTSPTPLRATESIDSDFLLATRLPSSCAHRSLCPDPRPKRWRRQLSTASAGFWLGGQFPVDARGAKKILKICPRNGAF